MVLLKKCRLEIVFIVAKEAISSDPPIWALENVYDALKQMWSKCFTLVDQNQGSSYWTISAICCILLEKCRLEIVIIVGEEATSSDLSVRKCLWGFETNVVKVLVNYFDGTRIIVELNLYWGQADEFQILFWPLPVKRLILEFL